MANRFPPGGERVAPYTKVVQIDPGSADLADGPTDAILIDGQTPSPSAITVQIGGQTHTFNSLTGGVIHPLRITRFTAGPNDIVYALYY
jgi:hypothetical protein